MVHSEKVYRVWDVPSGTEIVASKDGPNYSNLITDANHEVVACATSDFGIVIREIAPDRVRLTLRGHTSNVRSMRVSPDGRRVVADTVDNTCYIWDAVTGDLLHVIPDFVGNVHCFTDDGKRFATHDVATHAIQIYETETGRELLVLKGHEHNVLMTGFNHSGDRLVTNEGYPHNITRLWDLETGKCLHEEKRHINTATRFAFSPDDRQLATVGMEQKVHLWDGRTGKPTVSLQGHTGWVNAVRYSSNGKWFVTASKDRTVRIWDTESFANLATFHGHESDVLEATFTDDGELIVSASNDGTVRTWDTHIVERGTLRGHEDFVYSVAIHPDGKSVASTSWDGTARIWDSATGKQTHIMRYPRTHIKEQAEITYVTSVAFHPQGDLVAVLSRESSVRLWNYKNNKVVHSWAIPGHWQDSRVVFSHDGSLVIAGSGDNSVYIWDVATKNRIHLEGDYGGPIRDVAIDVKSKWVAAGGANERSDVRIWDLETKKLIHGLSGHGATVYALALAPSGRVLASGSIDGTVILWDTITWQKIKELKNGSAVHGLAFSPNGTRLATGCADSSIRLWDTSSYQQVAELRGRHTSYVHSLQFSPDGEKLISASGDKTLQIWDAGKNEK